MSNPRPYEGIPVHLLFYDRADYANKLLIIRELRLRHVEGILTDADRAFMFDHTSIPCTRMA